MMGMHEHLYGVGIQGGDTCHVGRIGLHGGCVCNWLSLCALITASQSGTLLNGFDRASSAASSAHKYQSLVTQL